MNTMQISWRARHRSAGTLGHRSPQQIPGVPTGRLSQYLLNFRTDPVDRPGQIRTDLQVGALAPAGLGELGDRAHDGFRGRSDLAVRPRLRLLEKRQPPLRQFPHVAGEDGPQYVVAAPEVIVHGRGVSLVGRADDIGDRDVVHPALGEEPGGGIEEEVGSGIRCTHATATVAGGLRRETG